MGPPCQPTTLSLSVQAEMQFPQTLNTPPTGMHFFIFSQIEMKTVAGHVEAEQKPVTPSHLTL